MKTCTKCKTEKPLDDFYEDKRRGPRGVAPGTRISWCKVCHTAASRERYRRNHERERARGRRNMYRQYGLTVEEYAAMSAAQSDACAICRQACVTGKRLAVDHDHRTGAVRGLLCAGCNTALGRLNDDVNLLYRAAEYLLETTK